jgi:mRNA interferase YafQ
MQTPQETSRVLRGLRCMRRRRTDVQKLQAVVRRLVHQQPLASWHRDHPLVGEWLGYRDCHIEPDWPLLYKIDREEATLTLVRTGTHSDLFEH